MSKQVVSIRAAKYERQYKDFYNNPVFREISRKMFFNKMDTTTKKVNIS